MHRGQVTFHHREKSAATFIRQKLVPSIRNPSHPGGIKLSFSYEIKGEEIYGSGLNYIRPRIIHLRDFRDMAVSDYWSAFSHPVGRGNTPVQAKLNILGTDPHNPKMNVTEFLSREDECIRMSPTGGFIGPDGVTTDRAIHVDGYTLRFFREAILKEYDSVLEFTAAHPERVKIVYYEDMVRDFKFYLNEMKSFGLHFNVEGFYARFSKEFEPEPGPWDDKNIEMNTFAGHKRRVHPGAYKEEMSKELSDKFASHYENYFFLERYLD